MYIGERGEKVLNRVFRRTYKGGWLILSGPVPTLEERALERLLEIVDPESSMIVACPGGEIPLQNAGWIEDLSAVLEIKATTLAIEHLPDAGEAWLRSASILILIGNEQAEDMEGLQRSLEAWDDRAGENAGVAVWLVGGVATQIGEWVFRPDRNTCLQGMEWLPGGLILQEIADLNEVEPIQQLLRDQHHSYALNLVAGATLAVGPNSEIDIWGSPSPKIVLGQGWGDG